LYRVKRGLILTAMNQPPPSPPCEVYIYGMTVLSTIHKLKNNFPTADGYQEIEQTSVIAGGEGANAAVVLSNLGLRVRLDGCFLGEATAGPLLKYLSAHQVDCSRLLREDDFAGWRDIVFCDGQSRTVFGWFVQYFSSSKKMWSAPCEQSIQQTTCVALDPFFREESQTVAQLCVKHGKDYVTIDCRHDDFIARNARAVVCSQEFLQREYAAMDATSLLEQYAAHCRGLVIFTFGARQIMYCMPGGGQAAIKPYSVQVVDTLAAGDTFRAAVVYGVVKQMSDDQTVRFASACAAVSCTRFPSVAQPPTMQEILALMRSQPQIGAS
jgi:sugar/nucleoside kinase (ribokinase family)